MVYFNSAFPFVLPTPKPYKFLMSIHYYRDL